MDFADFSNTQLQLPMQDSRFPQVSSRHEDSLGLGVKNIGRDWALTYSNGGFGQVSNSSNQENFQSRHNHPYTHTTQLSSRTLASERGPEHNTLFRNGLLNRTGMGVTAAPRYWQSPSISASASSQDSTLENTLEGLDWETVFASLEPTEQATDSQIPIVGRENNNYMFIDKLEVYETASSLKISSLGPTLTIPNLLEEPQINASLSGPAADHIKVQQPFLTTSDYRFKKYNPFIDSFNPFEEGMEIMRYDGNLSFAVLAFEAACQKEPRHFEAWRMLGSVQSENEQEIAAIIALNEALNIDPASLDIIMKLAISYTNEGTVSLAHKYLGEWLERKYPEIPIAEFGPTNYAPTFSQSLERIKEAFIQAAQLSLTTGNVDPDVQVGLGVLLFSAQNYELAADCFSSAIQTTVPGTTNTQSQLHLLWNRYGACLGNMKQHEAGINAYEMALAIRPNFVRARYNLGLLYHNKNSPLLGAQNTLQALKASRAAKSQARSEMMRIVTVGTSHGRLEDIIQRDEPTSIYETLRKCCGSLCRWDLVEIIGPDMDLGAFEKALDMI